MNENINLVEILKDAPTGTKLYSPLFGEILLSSIMNDEIICYVGDDVYFQGWEKIVAFNKYGQLLLSPVCSSDPTREVMIFPCEDSRDWSTFKAPWKHKHFKAFQKVLISHFTDDFSDKGIWVPALYGYYDEEIKAHILTNGSSRDDDGIIPYESNEDKLGKQVE